MTPETPHELEQKSDKTPKVPSRRNFLLSSVVLLGAAERLAAQSIKKAETKEVNANTVADMMIEKNVSAELKQKFADLNKHLAEFGPRVLEQASMFLLTIRQLSESEDGKAIINRNKSSNPDFEPAEELAKFLEKIAIALAVLETTKRGIDSYADLSPSQQKKGNIQALLIGRIGMSGPNGEQDITAIQALKICYENIGKLYDQLKIMETEKPDIPRTIKYIQLIVH